MMRGQYASYWWFRIRGYGLHFRWTRDGYTPLLSERNGYVKVLKIGRLWIKLLKPWPAPTASPKQESK